MIRNSPIRCYSTVMAANIAPSAKSYESIPGPKSYPFLGTVPHYLPGIGKYDPQNIIKSGMMKFKEFGPVVKESFFGHEAVFIYDPTDIEALFRTGEVNRRSHLTLKHIRKDSKVHMNGGMLAENGPAWYQLRSGSQQSMTTEAFSQYLPNLDEITLRLVNRIGKDEATEAVINKDFLLALLATNCDVICCMLFGLKLDSIQEVLNEEALTTKVIHSSTYFNRMVAPMDNGLMLWKLFPTPLYRKLRSCIEDVEFIPIREVESRLKNMSVIDGPGMLNSWLREGKLNSKAMITNLSDFLLAGIDTTSYTLAFTMYNLSVNKKVQDKLYKELCLLDPDSKSSVPVTMELLGKASYLKKVVKESMRLFPVSVGTSRVVQKLCVIGGYELPPQVTVITMNQITCRLDEYVERANEFIPERYESDSGFKKIRPYTSLPFGHGARACIGRRVAEMSMYTFLFRLFRRYEVEWVGDKPLDCIAHSITEPDGPLYFRFSAR